MAFSHRDMPADRTEFAQVMCHHRAMMRKMVIIANQYLTGDEKIAFTILMSSNLPAPDIANVLGLCQPEVYRLISYVKVLVREYYAYFEKKSYKDLRYRLHLLLPPPVYVALHVYASTRSAKIVAKLTHYSPIYVKRLLQKADTILKRHAVKDEAMRDLFVAWRRIGKVRKTAFSWYEKFLKKSYIKHDGRVIKSIRAKWVFQSQVNGTMSPGSRM